MKDEFLLKLADKFEDDLYYVITYGFDDVIVGNLFDYIEDLRVRGKNGRV